MRAFMLALARVIGRRRRLVVAVWAGLVAASIPFSARQTEHLTGKGFSVPGSPSELVSHALQRDFAGDLQSQLAVVLVPGPGARAASVRAAVDRISGAAARAPHVELSSEAERRALASAGNGSTVIVPLRLDVGEARATDIALDLRDKLAVGEERNGVTAHLVGQGALTSGLQEINKQNLADAEKFGFPVVLVILLGIFGSLAAAGLPLVLGIASVAVTGALIFFVSQAVDMFVFVTNAASMIGIGVAVDYSLFILTRYREEVDAGCPPETARERALGTSGVAVAFSGMTVIVSLGGLWLIRSGAIRSTGLGAMLVVSVSVLGAVTLLPALIGLLGPRAQAPGRLATAIGSRLRSVRPRPGNRDVWARWVTLVTARPLYAAVTAAALMLALAFPVLQLRIGTGALRQFPTQNETRVGFEQAAQIAGAGAFTEARILVTFRAADAYAPASRATVSRLRRAIAADPAVVRVDETPSRDHHSVLISATPASDGESAEAKAMVKRLQAELPGLTGARAKVLVGGVSAAQNEFTDQVSGSMWKLIVFVLALSYLVLLVLLRSVILPLKAVVMNLLSVGAAYGVLVALFQWRWLDWLGLKALGDVDSLIPPIVFAIVFGLSMDYEVFLLSRIRERYEATGDSRLAVTEGLASSARPITGAAVIMVAVFSTFVATGITSTQQLGIGLAVAIGLDATVVRLVLVPAMMELLGDWNWWLPRPLARILPRSSFERAPG